MPSTVPDAKSVLIQSVLPKEEMNSAAELYEKAVRGFYTRRTFKIEEK